MVTQIYYIQSIQEALDVIEAGADYIGLTPLQPKRPKSIVTYELARDIIEATRDKAVVTVLSTFDDPKEIIDMAKAIRPDIIQISGTIYFADEALVKELKVLVPGIKVMQAIPVTGPEAIDLAVRKSEFVDYLILDSVAANPQKAGGVIGAAGVAHDWNVSRKIVELSKVPVMLAGGLGPDNVAQAIREVHPWGVDTLTKTNRYLPDGSFVKDIDKVRAFCKAAKEADR